MKTALITGGSRGIGAQIVRQFRGKGWRVAFGYNESREEALALERETNAIPIRGDLRREEDTLRFFSAAVQQLSHVDALIVNAGRAWSGLITDMSTAEYDALMAVNLRSAFLSARECIPVMRRTNSGSILFISSIHGLNGAACEAVYAASKAGLIGLAKSLAAELGPSGIRVNCLAPGAVETEMMKGYSREELTLLEEKTPLHRLGTAEEVARAAFFLCSEEAGYITGQVLPVDGGLVL